ncbi:MAG: hypothetical protein EF806_00610 [Candidatus Methanoliparum thermophilum]|uniref:UPF0146 protein EF806_00610 n=1 Tax=Methanoliparum thermophilum TaxID=2491083 RepID=A0A520KTN2_METT2|nr:UPF0146 family protein [Candidatus Methanoliparum sp. LAM-1]RZN65428.1 MAG: hypothetical protein EF806_00610 [Candidatus Methanoliparum thermophilum]BDC35483.1 hypothetical protein MTLP_01650 [Candidatus Methanoliparum sp. LAM-1]
MLYSDLAEYIIKKYGNNKVIEIGVGKNFQLGILLYKDTEYIATDIFIVENAPFKIVIDDIFDPKISLYKNARLLVSINPPEEIQPEICKLGRRISANIIIKPLNGEIIDFKKYCSKVSIINYKNSFFYELRIE